MKTIVAIDDSPNARACIRCLCSFPAKDAEIEVLSIHADGAPALMPSISLSKEKAERLVNNAAAQLSECGYSQVNGLTPEGNAISEILHEADRWHPDVIILGAHSRNNLKEILVGNVANQVLRNAISSVMLVRERQENGAINLSRYLVCVDDSQLTDSIFSALKKFHWSEGNVLKFLHVMEPDSETTSEDPRTDAELCLERIKERRTHMKERLATEITALKLLFPQIQVSEKFVDELDAADTILSVAKSWDADLIILGSHRRQGMQRFLLGSVSEKVSAHANCSVYVVR